MVSECVTMGRTCLAALGQFLLICQDEHNRLGADGDICLPFEMSPVGYSDALQQSSD